MTKFLDLVRPLWRWRFGWVILFAAIILGMFAIRFEASPHKLRSLIALAQNSQSSEGILPTTVEDPSTAPHVLHPAQTAARQSLTPDQLIKVFAIHLGATPQDSTVVLGRVAASARTYVVGAVLDNGSEISAVYADRVELTRAAERYTLYTKGAEPGQAALAQSDEAAKALGVDSARTIIQAARPQARVEDFVRSVPEYSESGIQGFRVHPGSRSDLFARAGLQQGDMLVSVSGETSQTADQLAAQLQGLTLGQTLQAEIRRGQQTLHLMLDGGALVN